MAFPPMRMRWCWLQPIALMYFPALMRPGRFDRKVVLELPDKRARQQVLKVHTKYVPLAGDIDLEMLAKRTVGFSGADLANLVNEAALLTGRERKKQVDMEISTGRGIKLY